MSRYREKQHIYTFSNLSKSWTKQQQQQQQQQQKPTWYRHQPTPSLLNPVSLDHDFITTVVLASHTLNDQGHPERAVRNLQTDAYASIGQLGVICWDVEGGYSDTVLEEHKLLVGWGLRQGWSASAVARWCKTAGKGGGHGCCLHRLWHGMVFFCFFLAASLRPSHSLCLCLSPPPERKVPGSNPACSGIFSGSSHTSDFNIGTPVATLPGARRYRDSAGTGRPGVRILWLGEIESLICSFYLSVAARKIVCADPSLRYTGMLLGRKASNQQTTTVSHSLVRDTVMAVCWVCLSVSLPQLQAARLPLSQQCAASDCTFVTLCSARLAEELFVGCLTSQHQASVFHGRICTDNFTCCHTEIEAADPTFYLTQSQYTDTLPTSPNAGRVVTGVPIFESLVWLDPEKNPGASGIRTRDLPFSRRTPYH